MDESHQQVELSFGDNEALLGWYAELVAIGSVELPAGVVAVPGERLRLLLKPKEGSSLGLDALVLSGVVEGAPLRLQVTQTLALRERIYVLAMSRQGGRFKTEAGGARRHARFSTLLRVRYRSLAALFDDFVINISEGGLFVRTESPPPLHSSIDLTVQFPNGTEKSLHGEVVRVVTPEEADSQRSIPGVGVRIDDPTGQFATETTQLLSGWISRPRRVLVVDDDYFFLRVLSDALMQAGFEVASARGGPVAARKLVDLLYELDAVVLDLQMPGLDGYTLIDRIRRLGREMPLRIVLVSATPQELLEPLVGPQGAHAAISKSVELPELVRRVVESLQ